MNSLSYINEQLLTSTLVLHPSEITSDIDNFIKLKLKESIEGKSYEEGYIIKDSVRIIQRSIGHIVTNNKQSEIKYIIKYKATVVSPSENDELNITVNNVNKMGVLGFIKLKPSDDIEGSPLIVMVPKEYFDENASFNFNDINVGQQLDVIVVGARVKFNTKNIQVIARPI
jgi:DNA-directed RNA polymerase subunit E'/Rpb7